MTFSFLVESQKLIIVLCLQELKAELKSELGGKFEDVVLGLLEKPIDYDAIQLKEAVKVHIPLNMYYSYFNMYHVQYLW